MPVPPAHRPFPIRLVNGVGAGARRLGLRLPSLDPEGLRRTAVARTGADDFGGDGFQEGLEVLVDSLEAEASLTTIGRIGARETILGYLVNRLEIERHRRAHADEVARPVEGPVFIVGLPRTGTTILFNLLAQDLANRAPMSWEVHFPHPPPREATFETDPRIAEMRSIFARYEQLVPMLPAIHEFGAELPQECVPILAHEFLSIQWMSTFDVPSYQAWLERRDMTPAYRFHRRFLQHLQSAYAKERWVLKSPEHLPHLDALLDVYPDARIIHTHRDPARVLPSLASLWHATRSLNTDALDPVRIGRQTLDIWSSALARAVDARRRHAGEDRQFFDVQFEQVLEDPVAVLQRAYAHFGIPWSEETERRMRRFLADNPRGSRGVHRYEREDFGLELGEIRERFAGYCEAFDVPPVE